jgi:Ca2+-binding EF-hand superfamily protein
MTTATTLSNERIVQRFQLYDVNRDNVIERADLEAEA